MIHFLLSFQPYPKVLSGFCFCVDLIARCDRTIIAPILSHDVVVVVVVNRGIC